jgi:hypothetical protein
MQGSSYRSRFSTLPSLRGRVGAADQSGIGNRIDSIMVT